MKQNEYVLGDTRWECHGFNGFNSTILSELKNHRHSSFTIALKLRTHFKVELLFLVEKKLASPDVWGTCVCCVLGGGEWCHYSNSVLKYGDVSSVSHRQNFFDCLNAI